MNIRSKIKKILGLVNRAYGRPVNFNRTDPMDELIRTILSQNTTDKNSLGAFAALKSRFRSWQLALKADRAVIAGTIRHAGLANIKADRIKGVLREVLKREGKLSLAFLDGLSAESATAYLRSIKGVGPKTASCVLLFSFNKAVMPVDTHIFRVAKRLGLIAKSSSIEEAHERLSRDVPPRLIYNFHLGIIEHGRRTCKAQNPRCGACVLYDLCVFGRKTFFKKRGKLDKKS